MVHVLQPADDLHVFIAGGDRVCRLVERLQEQLIDAADLPALEHQVAALGPLGAFQQVDAIFVQPALQHIEAIGGADHQPVGRFQGQALQHNLSLVETLRRIAEAKGRTPGQLALAWVMHQGQDIVPIPGTTNLGRLEENVAAAEIRLSAAELDEISRAVPENAVEGDRYNAGSMAMVGLDTR